jgi:hypothetical protein
VDDVWKSGVESGKPLVCGEYGNGLLVGVSGGGDGIVKHRWLYPDNWEELARECKQRAGWCCEFCRVAHGTQVVSERTGVVYTVYLAAAHLDHDPWNPHPRLAALCQSCHGRYDWSWQERQRWLELELLRHRILVNQYVYGEQSRGGVYGKSAKA